MKKTAVILLALLLCFTLSVSVFADDLLIAPNPGAASEDTAPVSSPEDNPPVTPPDSGDDSPQTGIDNNVTIIWVVGIAAAVVLGASAYTAIKAKARG